MTANPTAPNRVKFEDLEASAFQHPLDRQATDNLKLLVGFDILVAKFLEFGLERLLYVYNIASAVQVGPKQFPRLNDMVHESAEILDVPVPEVFIVQSPVVNALTSGYTRPYVMLYTGLLDLMTEDEIRSTIAHELGHIKCGHVLYLSMANVLSRLTTQVTQMAWGIGTPVYYLLYGALLSWQRRAELSADRAELLVMQDARPVISAMTKFAAGNQRFANELSSEEFLNQARIYNEEMDKNFPDMLYRFMAETDLSRTHPFMVERVKEIDLWAGSQQYADILAGNYARKAKRYQIKVQAG